VSATLAGSKKVPPRDPRVSGDSDVAIELVEGPAASAAVAALFCEIWRTPPDRAPMSPELIRALAHTGGYVAAAYRGATLLGASVAFRTAYGLHSHISGVLPAAQGRQLGFALKQHQRAWALAHDLPTVSWTFDPLVRRNAWFNLTKLGATGEEYLSDFYGVMNGVNAGDLSDRMLARWDVGSPRVLAAAHDRLEPLEEDDLVAAGALVVLEADHVGRPVPRDVPADAQLLVRIPADIFAVREAEPALAREWRLAVREVLAPAMAGGRAVLGLTRSGCYVLGAPPEAHPPLSSLTTATHGGTT
jgi:predicted GNAT superfamily acetyltransferase